MYKIPSDYLYKDEHGYYRVKKEYYKPINNPKKIKEYAQGLFALRQLVNTPGLLKCLRDDLQTEYERKEAIRKIAVDELGKVNDEVNRILTVRPEFIGTEYFRNLQEIISGYTAVITQTEPTEEEVKEFKMGK